MSYSLHYWVSSVEERCLFLPVGQPKHHNVTIVAPQGSDAAILCKRHAQSIGSCCRLGRRCRSCQSGCGQIPKLDSAIGAQQYHLLPESGIIGGVRVSTDAMSACKATSRILTSLDELPDQQRPSMEMSPACRLSSMHSGGCQKQQLRLPLCPPSRW